MRKLLLKFSLAGIVMLLFQYSFGQVIFLGNPDSLAIVGEQYIYNLEFVASPNNAVFSLPTALDGMTIHPTTGVVTWTPDSIIDGGKVVIQATNTKGTYYLTYFIYVSNAIVCSADLISYWQLDEQTGPFIDYQNGYNAAVVNTDPEDTIGVVEKAQKFVPLGQTAQFMTVTDADQYEFTRAQGFSISLWFRNNGNPFGNNEVMIGRRTTGLAYWWFGINNSGYPKISFELVNQSGSSKNVTHSTSFLTSAWHHAVAVYTGAAPSGTCYITLYFDNIKYGPQSHVFSNDDFTGNGDVTFGYWDMYSTNRYPFKGVLDEVLIYNKALSQAEVAAIYSDGQGKIPHCKPGNYAPVIVTDPITSVNEDSPYSYDLNYSEIDGGDIITLTAPVKPSWLSFNATTGVLSGIPTNANVGVANVKLVVNDGEVDIEQSFTITVHNTNDAPVISSTPVTAVNEDSPYSYTLVASDVDVGDVLTLSALAKPNWLNFNAGTGLLSGTPTNAQVGLKADSTYSILLNVFDGTVNVSQNFNIKVTNINDAPVINGQVPLSTNEDIDLTITFSDLSVTDVDNTYPDDFTLTVLDGAHYSPIGNTVSPDDNWNGTLTVPIQLSDGDITVDYNLSLTVNAVNDAPVITSTPLVTATENKAYVYTITATDVDLDGLTFSNVKLPGWLSFISPVLTGTPGSGDIGIDTVILRVTDGTVNVDQQFFINILNVNDNPYFSRLPSSFADDYEPYLDTVKVDDPDPGDILTVSPVTMPNWLTLTQVGSTRSYTLSGTPKYNNTGVNAITLEVSDGSANVPQSFNINVGNTNSYPVITSTAPVSVNQGALYSYTFTATDVDEDDVLIYSALLKPSWLNFNTSTHILSGTPSNNNVGDHSVILRVSDGKASAEEIFSVTVENVNDAPEFTSSPITSAGEDVLYTYEAEAIDIDDDDVVTMTAPQLPGWLNFNTTTWILSGTPTNDEVGTHYVTLRASDGTASTDQPFQITVNNANDAPYFTSTPVVTASEDSLYVYSVKAADDDDDVLTFSAVVKPSWLNFSVGTGVLSGTPDAGDAGLHNVTIRVNDGTDSVDQEFTITVIEVNDKPVINGQLIFPQITSDSTLQITLSMINVSDEDNEPGDLSMIVLVGTGYSVSGNSINPDDDVRGNLTINIQVTDGEKASEVFGLTINVIPPDNIENGFSFTNKVYPNPANDYINFDLKGVSGEFVIQLYDITGRIVSETIADGNRIITIDTNSLKSGLYNYKLVSGKNYQKGTIVINK